jgi:hypothetical protein
LGHEFLFVVFVVEGIFFEFVDEGLEGGCDVVRIFGSCLEDFDDLVFSVLSVGDVVLDMGVGGFVTWNVRAMGGIENARLESEEGLEREHVCLLVGIRVGYR